MHSTHLRWQALVKGLTTAQKSHPDTLNALLIIGYNLDRIEYWQHQAHDVLEQSLRCCFIAKGHEAPPIHAYPESEPILEPAVLSSVLSAMTRHVNEVAQRQQELHIRLKELCQVLGLPYEEEG